MRPEKIHHPFAMHLMLRAERQQLDEDGCTVAPPITGGHGNAVHCDSEPAKYLNLNAQLIPHRKISWSVACHHTEQTTEER